VTRFVLGIELAQNADLTGAHASEVFGGIVAAKPRWIVVASLCP
jgi:hypothetical protein